MPRRRNLGAACLAAALAALPAPRLLAQTVPADAGARLYLTGVGTGTVTAGVAGGAVEAPGRLFPCVNCHKADGLGVLEGRLQPRDITWPALTGADTGRGYTDVSLRRAITEGLDAHGLPLNPAMPRYRVGPDDLDAVIAYLHTLAELAAPGVSGQDVRIATLLPLRGRLADTARAVERFLNLAVTDINTRRRFDGRRITLESVAFDPDVAGDALQSVQAAVASRPPFAFLANYQMDADVRRFIAETGIPDLAPLAAPDRPDDRSAVWIQPSVTDQAATLVDCAVKETGPRLGLISTNEPTDRAAAEAARQAIVNAGAELVLERRDPEDVAELVSGLRERSASAILVFAPVTVAAAVAAEAARQDWHPVLLGRLQQLGGLERDRATQRNADILLATTYGGVEPRSRGAYDFRRVAGELGGGHPELLRDAYVGAKLLETTLAATGRQLTRPRFMATIAGIDNFVTGVTAPLSFGPGASRRGGAAVRRLDPATGRMMPLRPGEP